MTPQTLGRYTLERRIGAGAFGAVYLGSLHGAMGFRKPVAIKLIDGGRSDLQPVKLGAIINEGMLGERLHHPNIVAILEFSEEAGQTFLVMEYIDGISLHTVLSLCAGRGTTLPVDAVCDLGIQVCAGLHHAHTLSDREGAPLELVHCDLKPANLLLDATGTVRIADFGVAQVAANPYFTTSSGELRGSPRYMAPEQARGGEPLTAAVDLYSLGLILCEAATGEPVYRAANVTTLLGKVAAGDATAALERTERRAPDLLPVLRRALAVRPEDRHETAERMSAALREVWSRHGSRQRMGLVARATMPLRPGGSPERPVGDQTDEVPVVQQADGEPGSWEHLCASFADQLDGVDPAELSSEPLVRPKRWQWGWLAAAAVVAAVAVASFFLWGSAQRMTTSRPVVEGIPTAARDITPAEQPPPTPPAEPIVLPAEEAAKPPPTRVESPPPVVQGSGFLRVNSRPWSQVWLGETSLGDTGTPSFEVPAGPHTVFLRRPGSGPVKSFQVDIPVQGTVNLGCWDFEAEAPCQ